MHGIGLATAAPLAEKEVPLLWHAGNYLIAQDLQLRAPFGRRRMSHRFGMHVLSREARDLIFKGDYKHIAFLSEAMRKEFVRRGCTPEHSYIVPRGIDFPLAEDLERPRNTPPVLLMASRIADEKGYDVALEAAILLARDKPELEWELHIAGSGREEYIESLRARARNGGIDQRVKFIGMLKREEVLDRMRNATAFISASLWEEPFGRTNIEALACGAPLVAADTGAIREIDGGSGAVLIYPKQDARALADALRNVLESSDLRLDLARKGIKRIKNAYTMDRILDMTEDVIDQVMKSYGKPFARPQGAAH
jgi:glycosyltransferase involved in cell wall biosynthesis